MAGSWGDVGPAYLEATEHAAALVELVEDELVIRAVNRALADLLGDVPATFVDQPAARFYPAAELADVHAKVTTALSDAEPLTYEAVRDLAQGRLVIVGRVLPLDGSRALIVGSDISRERTAEDRLARVEALADIGLWAWNVVDDDVEWSAQYRAIHGLSADVRPSVGRTLETVHRDDRDEVAAVLRGLVAQRRTGPLRYRVVRADGELRHVEGRAEVVRAATGEVIRVVGTVQDVTEQHELEDRERRLEESRRRQAQAMELNDDIVQELSRAWLALELEDVPTARQAIEATTRRVQDIVSGLLEATSVADGAVEPGSLVRQRPAGGAFPDGSAHGRRAHDRRDDRALLGPSGRSPT